MTQTKTRQKIMIQQKVLVQKLLKNALQNQPAIALLLKQQANVPMKLLLMQGAQMMLANAVAVLTIVAAIQRN